MSDRDLYLAAYDVADPRRLRQALQAVRGYASGGQKSVHEVHLTPAERTRLLERMGQLLDQGEDRFALVRMDPRATVLAYGRALVPGDAACIYFG